MFIFEFIGLWFVSFWVLMTVTFWESPRVCSWISGILSAGVVATTRWMS